MHLTSFEFLIITNRNILAPTKLVLARRQSLSSDVFIRRLRLRMFLLIAFFLRGCFASRRALHMLAEHIIRRLHLPEVICIAPICLGEPIHTC